LQVEIAGQGFDRDPGGTLMTTGELAGLIGLPRHSVPGFSVAEMPRLETNLSSGEGARIGEVMHLASANGVVCSLSGEKLVKHILVTGITGSGKTHTVQTLLARAGLPFMVLELANYSGGAEHLLVIEEAHRFLRREGASRLGEMDANPREHAIEFFANMLSELRATGQGVIIAEQIPSKIIPDVIKNTSTKIVHRLVAVDDQRAISTTLGLDEQDSRYLNELVTGEALIFKEGMGRAAKLRVAGLLLRFVGAHPQAVRDQAALERAVDQWVKLDAPAFKAQVVQLVLAQTGEGR
jgi:DNA helicase HerA-like ATPase